MKREYKEYLRLLPIAALTDLNEDSKEKEKIEMFNNLVNYKKYKVPLEDEISNWVLAGMTHT